MDDHPRSPRGSFPPEVVYELLASVSRAYVTGRHRLIEQFGFSRAQAEALSQMTVEELHRLSTLAANGALQIHVDRPDLDRLLAHIRSAQDERELQNELLVHGAPAELMQAMYGLTAADCAARRRLLGIAGREGGRPSNPSEAEEHAIWDAFERTGRVLCAQSFLEIAGITGIRLTSIWSLIKRWQSEGLIPSELSQSAPSGLSKQDAVAEPAQRYTAETIAASAATPTEPSVRRWSLAGLRERLAFRPDTEHEQGLIRFGIALGLPVYLLFALRYDSLAAADTSSTIWIFVCAWTAFIAISIALLVRTVLSPPRPSPARRLVAMATDFGGTAMFMSILGEFGALAYPVCVWAVLGHGVRYGTPYLVLAACLAVGGFSAVLAINPFWQANIGLGLSLLLGMLMLIVLIGTMLRHVHVDTQRDSRARRAALALITPRLRGPQLQAGDTTGGGTERRHRA